MFSHVSLVFVCIIIGIDNGERERERKRERGEREGKRCACVYRERERGNVIYFLLKRTWVFSLYFIVYSTTVVCSCVYGKV